MNAAPERALPTATTAPRTPSPGLANAVSAEWLKLRRQRSTWVLIGLGVVALALVLLVGATSQSVRFGLLHHSARELDQWIGVLESVFAAGAGIALLILSSRLMGMEYGLGTLRIILARGTSRGTLLAAKVVAMALLGLAFLVGYAVLAGMGTALAVLHQTGSLSLIAHLPAQVGHHALVATLAAAISALACVVVGLAVATLTRSMSAATAVALVFFPVDNALVLVLVLLQRATHLSLFSHLTAFLLGPTLNHMPVVLKLESQAPFAIPTVHVGLTQSLVVVAGWLVVLLVLAIASVRSRDVLA